MIPLASNIGVASISGMAWFGAVVLIDLHHREKGSTRCLFTSLFIGFASIPLVIFVDQWLSQGEKAHPPTAESRDGPGEYALPFFSEREKRDAQNQCIEDETRAG